MVKIRELEPSDIRKVKSWLNDPMFRSDFIPYDREISEDDFSLRLSNTIRNKNSTERFLVIVNGSTLAGLLLCMKPEKFDYCEIGYYVIPNERRKNIATKALSDLVEYCVQELSCPENRSGYIITEYSFSASYRKSETLFGGKPPEDTIQKREMGGQLSLRISQREWNYSLVV